MAPMTSAPVWADSFAIVTSFDAVPIAHLHLGSSLLACHPYNRSKYEPQLLR